LQNDSQKDTPTPIQYETRTKSNTDSKAAKKLDVFSLQYIVLLIHTYTTVITNNFIIQWRLARLFADSLYDKQL